ncbi:MAG: DNA polymerase III subunit gamma/tau, partial [Brevinema sp.]
CQEITLGQALDVREIDGASNRGIEQIREIRDNAVYTPLSFKYKIFIIDEVHMLTKEASNALLKVLEEPPAHIIFMLATTEPNKVLPTIRSRCQHYLLKKIPLDMLISRLETILKAEQYHYDRDSLELIAKAGDGSMRDSQTILDQVILYTQGNLTIDQTKEVLGIPADIYFERVVEALLNQDIIIILEQVDTYLSEAGDGVSFTEHLTKFLRQGLLIKKLPATHPLINMSDSTYQKLSSLFQKFTDEELLILVNLALELSDILRKEVAERFWIESTLFKMLDYKNRIPISTLRQEILKIVGRDSGFRSKNQLSSSAIPQKMKQSNDPIATRNNENNILPSQTGVLSSALQQQEQRKKLPAVAETQKENVVPITDQEHNISATNVKKQISIDSNDREGLLRNLFEIL